MDDDSAYMLSVFRQENRNLRDLAAQCDVLKQENQDLRNQAEQWGVLKQENQTLREQVALYRDAEQQVQRRLLFERTLTHISGRFVGAPDIDGAIVDSLQEMAATREARRAYVYLFNNDGLTMENSHEWCSPSLPPQGEKQKKIPLAIFPYGMDKIKRGEIVHIRSSSTVSGEDEKATLKKFDIRSLLLIPLSKGGCYGGFLGFESDQKVAEWTDDDASMLRVASEVIGRALEQKEQQQELQRQMHNISILYDVGKALNFLDDLTKLLAMILDKAVDIAGSQKGSLMLYDEKKGDLVVRVVRGLKKELEEKILQGEIQCRRIKIGEGVAGSVFTSGEPIIINDIKSDLRFKEPEHSWVESILCVPLSVYDEPIGVINITNKKNSGLFTENDLDMIIALANQAAVAISNARLYELAITDSLTKVLIRRHFLQRLDDEIKRSKRYGHTLSLVMADFDHFKEINDRYGHQAGDQVLMEMGKLFKKSLRSSDFVGRYGGEEFCIALPETDRGRAVAFCRRLSRLAESKVFNFEGVSVTKTLSMGVASYPDHAKDYQELIRCADLSLYKAKNDGRNRICLYDDVLSQGQCTGNSPEQPRELQ